MLSNDDDLHEVRFLGFTYDSSLNTVVLMFDTGAIAMPLELFRNFIFQAYIFDMNLQKLLIRKAREEEAIQKETASDAEKFLENKRK
jgi:hypothetical protein